MRQYLVVSGLLLSLIFAGCLQGSNFVGNLESPSYDLDFRPNSWPGTFEPNPKVTLISSGAEPSILVSKDGKSIWIGDTSGVYRSHDHGNTWQTAAAPTMITTMDGWSLAEDDAGYLYYATTNGPSLEFVRSADGGRTAEYSSAITDVAPVADRPWIAATGDGEVVIFMYDFGRSTSETCIHSTNHGNAWSDRGLLSGWPQGGGALFDDDGNMYVGIDDGIIFDYGTSCLMASGDLGVTEYDMFHQELGSNNMLKPAHEDGILYMAAVSADNRRVLLSGHSLEGTSPKVVTVSPDILASNAFATLSVHDGRIAVAWYGSETEGDPTETDFEGAFNVYVAIVDHFWDEPNVEVTRLTVDPNHVGDICMGGIGCSTDASADRDLLDYFDVDHDPAGGVHIAYGADGTGDDAEVYYAFFHPPKFSPSQADDGTAPSAYFEYTVENLTVWVDARSSTYSDGQQLSFTWSWGDGTFSEGATAIHNYTGPGTYQINLTVTDIAGEQAELSRDVNIVAAPSANVNSNEASNLEKARPLPGWSIGPAILALIGSGMLARRHR